MPEDFDVAVVGSGPSGALAAATLVDAGLRVLMLDVAHDDDRYRSLVPDRPFHELRHEDPQQRRYFLGDQLEGVPEGAVRVGAQLTPPRQYVTRAAEQHLPYRGEGFDPMQSLALGGLGATWGAASFTYTAEELRALGIHEPGFEKFYDEVARRVGISGDPDDDASQSCFGGVSEQLPPLELDSVTRDIWQRYGERRDAFRTRGLSMGRTPLAILSRDFGERQANPYFDMDFWSESRRSVFRPRYLIEELQREPGFTLEKDQLVLGFRSDESGVSVRCHDLRSGRRGAFRARRLVLCAGALNSARIALRSLGLVDQRVPLLCNPYRYVPCINLRRLGRDADERRHSLSQLVAIYEPPDDPSDVVSAQFYGYRSLLMFKLVKEIPLPPWAGLLVARLVLNSLVIVGLHHSDAVGPGKTLRIGDASEDVLPELRFEYEPDAAERERRARRERALSGLLLRLGVVPYARIDPGAASSIHYAGTLPIQESNAAPFATRADGRLWHAPHVYAGDSASWQHLPAKGLTYTIMANAVRVAGHVARELRSSP